MSLYIVLFILMVIFFLARLKVIFVFVAVLLLLLLLRSGTFVVNEGSQVVLTQFGKIVGSAYTKPGLYFKIPFLWKANYFDRRIYSEEDIQVEVATHDAYFITVSSVINWRIKDPVLFFQNMHSLSNARELLKNIVAGEVRGAVAKYKIVNTEKSKDVLYNLYDPNLSIDPNFGGMLGLHNNVTFGRKGLGHTINQKQYLYTDQFGIEVLGVLITNINYGKAVEKSINERMILERLTKATQLRSTGLKNYERILGEIQRKYQSIVAPALKEAELIKGRADAKATEIYAKSFNVNPSFYHFWRTLIAYEKGIPPQSKGTLFSTSNAFLKLLDYNPATQMRPGDKSVQQEKK